MLATYGFFFDFITGKTVAEKITEQYYKDVVAILTIKEYREISVGVETDEKIHINDAPTFTLSLASGEQRTVTFVNANYFLGIRDKLNISETEIRDIYWVRDSEVIAENAIRALRYHLRQHKGSMLELNIEEDH
jgi:hypothetical protein